MDERLSVLIADDNSSFCRILCDEINNTDDMHVVAFTGDGKTAVKLIYELEPDIVLLDIIMPRLDGIGVLEKLRDERPAKMPLVCVFTAIGNDIVVRNALELGADFYILKPFDIGVLINRIRQLYNEKNAAVPDTVQVLNSAADNAPYGENGTEKIVTDIIRSIGITPNLAGYNFLRKAVILAVNQPERLENVAKNIYPEIASEHGTNVRNIDRAIRCALLSAQKKTINTKKTDQDPLIMINGKKSPNSAHVIRYLAELTRQKQS